MSAGVTDEFVVPVVCDGGRPPSAKGTRIIFFNFRPDRAREITRAFVDPEFNGFCRRLGYFPVQLRVHHRVRRCHAQCHRGLSPAQARTISSASILSQLGLTQLRIAETEKYAHVTFFFNGGSGTGVPRGGPLPDPLPQGGHL